MNLTESLERQLVESVLRFVGNPPAPDTVAALIGHGAQAEAPPGANAFNYATWIVRYSLRRPTKDIFVRLVQLSDTGDLVALQSLVAELEADSSKWSAPVEGLWIPTGWPFVDRASLRNTLATMANGAGPPALSIEGSFGNGKRTMAAFIRHLADETNAFEPVIRDLRPEPEPGTLFDVATELSMALGEVPDLETTHAEPERQATTLARQAALAAPSAPIPVWFLANVMEHAGLEEGVLVFVDELLRLVQSAPQIAAKLRVLVLCDQVSLLELENAPPLDARHTLPQITDTEIREWLEAAAPGKDPTLYQLAAETVVRSLEDEDVAPTKKLRLLSMSCKLAHRKLAA
jgi:hypothetical protein